MALMKSFGWIGVTNKRFNMPESGLAFRRTLGVGQEGRSGAVIKRLEKLRVKLAEWIAPAGYKVVRPKARTVCCGGVSGFAIEQALLEVLSTVQNDLAVALQSHFRGCVASGPFAGPSVAAVRIAAPACRSMARERSRDSM